MNFVLPLPPPENERLIFSKNHSRFILGSKYRDYKKHAQWELFKIKAQQNIEMKTPTLENQLKINIKCYMPNLRRDHHGILKPLLDVMEGIIYHNDKFVVPIFDTMKLDRDNPRVEIEI